MTRRSASGLFTSVALLAALSGCAPTPGVSGAPGTAAYVQHLAPDQVDTWRGVHYDGLILDVRSSAEWEDDLNHLDNAVAVPVETLEARLPEFERYKSLAVLVYDRTGANSTRASQILASNGFKDVSAIDGGLKAYRDWQKASHP